MLVVWKSDRLGSNRGTKVIAPHVASLRHLQDAVVEDDEVDVRVLGRGGEDAVRSGTGVVDSAGEGLRWSRSRLGLAVGAPVAGELLTCGVDKAAVCWIAEVDDVEWRNGVASYDRAAKRIGTAKEKTEPSRASTSYSAVTGSGAK